MKILLTKLNHRYAEKVLNSKLTPVAETTNTITVSISEKKFQILRNHLRDIGINTYSFMSW